MNNSQTSVFLQDYLAQTNEPVIKMAFNVYSECQSKMIQRFDILKALFEKKEIEALYNYEMNLFQHDDWVRKEFQGGYFSYMFTHDGGMQGVIDQAEIALQVSGNVACMLLEKVRDTMNDQRYHL